MIIVQKTASALTYSGVKEKKVPL